MYYWVGGSNSTFTRYRPGTEGDQFSWHGRRLWWLSESQWTTTFDRQTGVPVSLASEFKDACIALDECSGGRLEYREAFKERERVDPFFDGTHFTRIVSFPISNDQMIAISHFTLSKWVIKTLLPKCLPLEGIQEEMQRINCISIDCSPFNLVIADGIAQIPSFTTWVS